MPPPRLPPERPPPLEERPPLLATALRVFLLADAKPLDDELPFEEAPLLELDDPPLDAEEPPLRVTLRPPPELLLAPLEEAPLLDEDLEGELPFLAAPFEDAPLEELPLDDDLEAPPRFAELLLFLAAPLEEELPFLAADFLEALLEEDPPFLLAPLLPPFDIMPPFLAAPLLDAPFLAVAFFVAFAMF